MRLIEPETLIQGRYRVVRPLGRGGMGAVYEAADSRLGHRVALKQRTAGGDNDSKLAQAFEREAKLLARLSHPALPRVIDHFSEPLGQFLVMDFVPGDNLLDLLSARGAPFEPSDALAVADQVLDVLSYLKQQDPVVVHRDIKPQNLKRRPDGRVILLDFGLAKGGLPIEDGASASVPGCTPQYAPLEQYFRQGTDPRSDLYSLGATLLHLLCGQPPPSAAARATAVLGRQPDPLKAYRRKARSVPRPLAETLDRLMELAAEDRPDDIAALRDRLRVFMQTPAAPASGTAKKPAARKAPGFFGRWKRRLGDDRISSAPPDVPQAPLDESTWAPTDDLLGSMPAPTASRLPIESDEWLPPRTMGLDLPRLPDRTPAHRGPALQRAQSMGSSLLGARVLWVDDHPESVRPFRGILGTLGVEVASALDTEQALRRLAAGPPFDLILSDIDRGTDPEAGLKLLRTLRAQGDTTPLLFFVGQVDPDRGIPPGALGITSQGEEMLHLALDVLEATRAHHS